MVVIIRVVIVIVVIVIIVTEMMIIINIVIIIAFESLHYLLRQIQGKAWSLVFFRLLHATFCFHRFHPQ